MAKPKSHRRTKKKPQPASPKALYEQLQEWSNVDFKYPALLAVLVLFVVLQPLLLGLFKQAYFFDVMLAMATIGVGFTLLSGANRRWMAIGLGVPAVFLSLSSHAIGPTWQTAFSLMGHLFGLCFLSTAVVILIIHVMLGMTSLFNKILGSICGYLVLGIAVAYSMLDEINPDAFNFNVSLAADIENHSFRMNLFIYYSFVTLTTLGYGDVTPIDSTARVLSWVEAVLGQFYIAILVAGLVSQLSTEYRQQHESKQLDDD